MKKLLATILFASFVLVVYARDNKQWMKDIDDSYPLTMQGQGTDFQRHMNILAS